MMKIRMVIGILSILLCFLPVYTVRERKNNILCAQTYTKTNSLHNQLATIMDDESIADIVNEAVEDGIEQATDTLEGVADHQAGTMDDDTGGEGVLDESLYTETSQEGRVSEEIRQQQPMVNNLSISDVTDQALVEASAQVVQQSYQEDTDDPDAVNIQEKRAEVLKLLEKGEKYLRENQPYDAMNAFTFDKNFRHGEIYLVVMDRLGTILAHGQQAHLIWQNLIDERDSFGSPFVKMIIKQAHRGGGWVTYQWRGATKISYAKEVVKDGTTFVISAGFYPHSKSDAVISLVKGAVAVFKQAIKAGRSKEEIFSTLSYPLGRFVLGDLYLYALDFYGVHMAHGDRPGLIGTTALEYQDATGKFVNKEIIAKLQEGSEGVWIDYISKNAPKRTYAEKVTDKEGKSYFIACGYYPDADRRQLVDLVRRGYEYMKSHGVSSASSEFSDKKINNFRYGDLYLVVFDMKGKVIAHGGNTDFIGQNFYNDKDQDGHYYVRDIIEQAKKQKLTAGGGEAAGEWVNYKMRNSFVSAYIKPIKLGLKDYVIVAGLYPITKKETAVLLARSGSTYLRAENEQKAFRAFVEENGKFVQGDLYIFVFAFNGICVAYGDNESYIWQNMFSARDDKNMPYVQVFINTVKQGAGKVTYTINGVQRVVFIDRVDKGGRSYVVGSGYFK